MVADNALGRIFGSTVELGVHMYLDRVLIAANHRARQYTSKISALSLAALGELLFLCPTAVSK